MQRGSPFSCFPFPNTFFKGKERKLVGRRPAPPAIRDLLFVRAKNIVSIGTSRAPSPTTIYELRRTARTSFFKNAKNLAFNMAMRLTFS